MVLAATLAACGSGAANGSGGSSSNAGGSSGSTQSWVDGIVTPKGDSGYILMAKARNYYKQMGVNVTVKPFIGNVQLEQALLSGAVDSIESGAGPTISADAKGANLKFIGSTLPTLTYALIAKSSIKTFKDLEGKTIGASAPKAFPQVVTEAMLSAKNLNPHNVKVVNSGNDAQRFQALLHGRIDAAAVSSQFVPKAKANPKLHVLGTAQSVIPWFPRFNIIASEKSLKAKPKAAVAFLAAEMKGLCYAVQNPKAEIDLAAKTLGKKPTNATIVYDQKIISKAKAASPTSVIPLSNLERYQNFRLQKGFQKTKVDLTKYADGSYRQKALKLAKLPKACVNYDAGKQSA
jgi:NitT/TauT family transport system substrate-binding protein